jgi:hypothetical protein
MGVGTEILFMLMLGLVVLGTNSNFPRSARRCQTDFRNHLSVFLALTRTNNCQPCLLSVDICERVRLPLDSAIHVGCCCYSPAT